MHCSSISSGRWKQLELNSSPAVAGCGARRASSAPLYSMELYKLAELVWTPDAGDCGERQCCAAPHAYAVRMPYVCAVERHMPPHAPRICGLRLCMGVAACALDSKAAALGICSQACASCTG
jgi:hypothetical protein